MLSKFLDPKNDVAFRKIFCTEKNKNILIPFLNDVLAFESSSLIQDVTFLPPNQDPEISLQKTSIVDILCKDQRGNRYIVEIQVAKDKGFEKRAQYYASKAYCSQMNMEQKFDEGLERGRAEGAKKALIQVAQKLLNQGLSIPEVQTVTQLPLEELSEL